MQLHKTVRLDPSKCACMPVSVKVNKDHEERKEKLLFSSSGDLGSKQQC